MAEDHPDRPPWWRENDRLRRRLGLPAYEPPRLADGTYVHEVVPDLESRFDCEIRLRSVVNPAYPEAWELHVDCRRVTAVERHRDDNGNTVFELSPRALRRLVGSAATDNA